MSFEQIKLIDEIEFIGIVNHNAVEGCQKCTVTGEYMNNRMSFPRINCPKRTDLEFRNRAIPAHHREYSMLEELPINMIDDFVTSDDLHLLHLGIMKKCLIIWKEGKHNFEYKWKDNDIANINRMLQRINSDMPTDIHRSVRTLNCLKFWKGTELRTFLLYIGVAILKNFLRKEEYTHFLKLYCAVTVCSTDKFFNRNRVQMSNFARELFDEYIEGYIDLYGMAYISSNVHNLHHIVDDVLKFGNLTKISSYPFENCLYGLKLKVRNCNRPLEQISRRISELNLDFREPIDFEQNFEPELRYPFDNNGELAHEQILFGSNIFLSSRKFGDKWVLTNDGQVIEFHFALKRDDEYLFNGSCMENLGNFFKNPIQSKKIYVFSGKNEKSAPKFYKIENVMAKMICLHIDDDEFIFMPLLHTLK